MSAELQPPGRAALPQGGQVSGAPRRGVASRLALNSLGLPVPRRRRGLAWPERHPVPLAGLLGRRPFDVALPVEETPERPDLGLPGRADAPVSDADLASVALDRPELRGVGGGVDADQCRGKSSWFPFGLEVEVARVPAGPALHTPAVHLREHTAEAQEPVVAALLQQSRRPDHVAEERPLGVAGEAGHGPGDVDLGERRVRVVEVARGQV